MVSSRRTWRGALLALLLCGCFPSPVDVLGRACEVRAGDDAAGTCQLDGYLCVESVCEREYVAWGSAWRFEDDGTDLGTAWLGTGYDDSRWKQGNAAFGYGPDAGQTTLVDFGPDSTHKRTTDYFRRHFQVGDEQLSQVVLHERVDDGLAVYLNGTEAFRDNLPTGPVNASTFAVLALGPAEAVPVHDADLAPELLHAGDNVVEVEVHQATLTTTDMIFDLELHGAK